MLCTSLLPAGYEAYAGVDGVAWVVPESVRPTPTPPRPGDHCATPAWRSPSPTLVCFFAYPWPEERELMQKLFEAVAREGAMLVVYHTDTDIRVFRKV